LFFELKKNEILLKREIKNKDFSNQKNGAKVFS